MRNLTTKNREFCNEYVKDYNPLKALERTLKNNKKGASLTKALTLLNREEVIHEIRRLEKRKRNAKEGSNDFVLESLVKVIKIGLGEIPSEVVCKNYTQTMKKTDLGAVVQACGVLGKINKMYSDGSNITDNSKTVKRIINVTVPPPEDYEGDSKWKTIESR